MQSEKFPKLSVAFAKIGVPLVIGLAIREIFASFTGNPYDMELWIRAGYYVSIGHDPYTQTSPVQGLSLPSPIGVTWIGYPPIWAFIQAGLYKVYSLCGSDNRFAYYFLIKQPMVLADLVVGYLLYKIVGVFANEKSGAKAGAFWLICPYTIIISSVWGMFDQIILMLLLATIFLASETRKSALLESFGIVLKFIPVIYLPLLALIQRTKTKIIGYLAVSIGASSLFALAPYLVLKDWNVFLLVGVGVDETTKLANSLNYWGIVALYSNYYNVHNAFFYVLRYVSLIWIPALLLSSYFCIKSIRGRNNLEKNLAMSMLLITLVFFLTKSVINEQYVIYFIGLGLIDYFVSNSKHRKRLFHAVWITSLAFLIANNDFLVRFLAPVSSYYSQLSSTIETGLSGELRFAIMVVTEFMFTAFSLLYLHSLHEEISMVHKEKQPIANQ